MSVLQTYKNALAKGALLPDPAQRRVAETLQQLFARLCAPPPSKWRQLFESLSKKPGTASSGLYLWGGVGRGKTMLMDMFYEQLPFEQKTRLHYHRFMQLVTAELDAAQGIKNPMQKIVRDLARRYRVLCIDEFFVIDIGHAMLIAKLLETLFANQITLLITSNLPPEKLYQNGLQRQSFLPAIALLQNHAQVCCLENDTDYRLRALQRIELYHHPLDDQAESLLNASFSKLAPEQGTENTTISILGRSIPVRWLADDTAWFEFSALCGDNRSQADYIELGKQFHSVLVGGIPQLDAERDDQARRFILLIDEFYDRRVKMVLSADMPLNMLYSGSRLKFEFQRTQSRLQEMQSQEYLAAEHRPM